MAADKAKPTRKLRISKRRGFSSAVSAKPAGKSGATLACRMPYAESGSPGLGAACGSGPFGNLDRAGTESWRDNRCFKFSSASAAAFTSAAKLDVYSTALLRLAAIDLMGSAPTILLPARAMDAKRKSYRCIIAIVPVPVTAKQHPRGAQVVWRPVRAPV